MLVCREQFTNASFGHKDLSLGYSVSPHTQLRHPISRQKNVLAPVHAHYANSPIMSQGQSPVLLCTIAAHQTLCGTQGLDFGP